MSDSAVMDISDIAPEEETPVQETPSEESVEAPAEEAPVEEPAEEAPVEAPAEEPAPVEEPAEEEPAPVEEPVPVEEAPEPVTSVPVEQVASDIREILTAPTVISEPVSSELSDISLATLVRVLGQWSGNEIKRRNVESELLSGTETDENLDDIEKVVEVLQLWIQEGGPVFREHNHFKNLGEYTLSGVSRGLSEEKKVVVLKTLTNFIINVSQRRVDVNNIYSIFS